MDRDRAKLIRSCGNLLAEAEKVAMTNTRLGHLAAAGKFKEAAMVGDLVGGALGASLRANADHLLCNTLTRLGDMAATAEAACSSLRAARASDSRTMLVKSLFVCGEVARIAPSEMVNALRASGEQERVNGSPPTHGGLDLSQEGWISLPTTPVALSRLGHAYNEAAVAICNKALAEAGGRGNPAANDGRVPDPRVEAQARASLGVSLYTLGEEPQRSVELLRQAVALWRLMVRTAAPGDDTLSAQRGLADELSIMGVVGCGLGFDGIVEAEACLREALALGGVVRDLMLTVKSLRYLINLCGQAPATVGRAEAETFRSRLNQCLVQMGRSPETSCSICLEPLAPPADAAAGDAASGSGSAGGSSDCVRVLGCDHQFHHGCLTTWRHTTSNRACPICKKMS